MNKLLLLSAALCLAVSAPMSAHAAGAAVNAGAAVSGDVKGGSTDATANASGSATAALSSSSSYSDVVSGMSGSGSATIDFSKTTAASSISIVKISTLKGYAAGNASMKTAMSSNTNMKSLDAKIAANADLTAKLKAAGFTPNDVVAASTDASGGVTLFVNDGK